MTTEGGLEIVHEDPDFVVLNKVSRILSLPGPEADRFLVEAAVLENDLALPPYPLPIPDHKTLSRRRQGLTVQLDRVTGDNTIHLFVDSTSGERVLSLHDDHRPKDSCFSFGVRKSRGDDRMQHLEHDDRSWRAPVLHHCRLAETV